MENKNRIFTVVNPTSSSQTSNRPAAQDERLHRSLYANQLQIAVINKMLPKGFKFETLENLKQQKANAHLKLLPVKRARRVSSYKTYF